MIVESFIYMFMNFIGGLLDLVPIVKFPIEGISALCEFTAYGTYVVGSEFMVMFCSLIFAWASCRFLIGIGIRIWELLPFT